MNQIDLADQSYVRDQYRASKNLDARIVLHERFSTADQKWFDWYWDHLDLPINARILEIGCGTGMLWRDNRTRIPPTWHLTLSDFSLGMIETARAANVPADFLSSDAQAIPFRNNYFDAVIANHMLYHVPNRAQAISEVRRVLKPNGKFYAATNGDAHLRELKTLISGFIDASSTPLLDASVSKQFSLENGAQQLAKSFVQVERLDFDDALVVTEIEPLVAYIMSGFMGKQLLHAENEESHNARWCDSHYQIDRTLHCNQLNPQSRIPNLELLAAARWQSCCPRIAKKFCCCGVKFLFSGICPAAESKKAKSQRARRCANAVKRPVTLSN